jgi:hypothetical protein
MFAPPLPPAQTSAYGTPDVYFPVCAGLWLMVTEGVLGRALANVPVLAKLRVPDAAEVPELSGAPKVRCGM